jgi:two-component system phosphate regulon sensor histidine kinase PhoR
VEAAFDLADRLGVGLLVISEGVVTTANESAHRLLGERAGTLIGKTTMEAFVDHRVEEAVIEAAGGVDGELELSTTTEPVRTIEARARDAGEGAVEVLLVDVSELRRLRRIRTQFIDNLSHELRTPIATVRLLTESLERELDRTSASGRVRDTVAKIDVETAQLAQMVDELVDLSAIEQGEARLKLLKIDLATVVDRTVERLAPYARQRGVHVNAEASGVPGHRTVLADADRLGQLLVNIVHNAIKFSPADGQVTIRTTPVEHEVLVEVQDSGPGIPRRDLGRVFERFYKVDRSRADGGAAMTAGTGLGLSIARHIAERHGGRLWAESERGKGARFTLALPAAARREGSRARAR